MKCFSWHLVHGKPLMSPGYFLHNCSHSALRCLSTELGTPGQTSATRKQAPRTPALSTYINKVRQVVDVVLEDRRIGCLQSQ